MIFLPVSIPLLLLPCFLLTFTSSSNTVNRFAGDCSINCGSAGVFTASNSKKWIGDVMKPTSASYLQIEGSSITSAVTGKLLSGDRIPHRTARVSHSRFSYAFRVTPGQKIVRLHFTSAPYKGSKGLKDLFTVEAGPFTLLANFSPSLAADALGIKGLRSFSKEFCLNVNENEQLNVTFHPESSQSGQAYAFVNGIEIISVPATVSYVHGGDIGVQVVGQKSPVHVDIHTALELVHRLNIIKENSIPAGGDFDDTFPMWGLRRVEKVNNRTWNIPVDVGFRYMVRLHVSKMSLKIAGTGDVMFKILINEVMAHTNMDLVKESKDNGNNIYRDYLVTVRGRKDDGKHNLSISLQYSPDELVDGLQHLSGFEIFKLSNPDNSLASPNPLPPPTRNLIFFSAFHNRNVYSLVAVIIIAIVSIIADKLSENAEAISTRQPEKNKPSAKAERVCLRFSLVEIQFATRDFNGGLLIGRGGFGKVYKGFIDRGSMEVAVKRLNPNSSQGAHEFLMEIETLSELRHVNLVSLIGYCNQHHEMILVYDYMPGGTLADRLYRLQNKGVSCPALNWKERLNICIGAGRGLDYLHTGHGIIHRDVKSTNILLDENCVAKVSDFGLAKHEDKNKLQTHVSTRVKGTNGYMDPHYLHTRKLTRKTDTYAFGVVLFEILSGRAAVDVSLAEEEHILTIWARNRINNGEAEQIVDLSLREEIMPASLKTFVGIAERCLREDPKNRPTMSWVVQQLELALEQQDSGRGFESDEIASASSSDVRPSVNEKKNSDDKGQSAVVDQHVGDVKSPQEEQTRSEADRINAPSVRRGGRKGTARKPLRLWPWDAFWNRVKMTKKNISLSEIEEIGNEAKLRATKYDWNVIVVATNQFSDDRKIGQGGFGSVYKGVLPTGQLVAVRRRSFDSRKDIREFMNEIHYLPNIQHRNIIHLLGYGIRPNSREEMVLVYEFIENASMDTFIGVGRHRNLTWEVRFEIIRRIAQGLAYLHHDSGLRVVHRDVSLRHILLDFEMNPKISGFTFARALPENDSQVETRVVGTYWYIAPESCKHGRFTVKTDVYSFGIMVLEIVSGKRMSYWRTMNTSYSEPIDFHAYAWELWNQGRACDLIDETLEMAFLEKEAQRCVQVGLMCTQSEPNQRPEMTTVRKILEGDNELLVYPHPPGPPSWPQFTKQYSISSSSGATCDLDDTLER